MRLLIMWCDGAEDGNEDWKQQMLAADIRLEKISGLIGKLCRTCAVLG